MDTTDYPVLVSTTHHPRYGYTARLVTRNLFINASEDLGAHMTIVSVPLADFDLFDGEIFIGDEECVTKTVKLEAVTLTLHLLKADVKNWKEGKGK